MTTGKNIQIIEANLNDSVHAKSFLKLTAAYMADEMGGAEAWTEDQKTRVLQDLKDMDCVLIFLAKVDGQYVGICTCFYAYSTFLAKPLLNIHDIYVEDSFRGYGIGKKLVQSIEDMATKKDCGKITLEVRKDNLNARDLYKSEGFTEALHSKLFWVKHC